MFLARCYLRVIEWAFSIDHGVLLTIPSQSFLLHKSWHRKFSFAAAAGGGVGGGTIAGRELLHTDHLRWLHRPSGIAIVVIVFVSLVRRANLKAWLWIGSSPNKMGEQIEKQLID